MLRKLLLSGIGILAVLAMQAQQYKGWNAVFSYQPVNIALKIPSYWGSNGYQPGVGYSLGVTRSIIDLDKKLHTGISFGAILRRQHLEAENHRTNFTFTALDVPIEMELGAKNFGLQFGFSLYSPIKYKGEIYSPDSSASAAPYIFGDNNNNADKEVPWTYLKLHGGAHLSFYGKKNMEKLFRFTVFANAGASVVAIGPFKKGAPYKAPLPVYVEAGIALCFLKEN